MNKLAQQFQNDVVTRYQEKMAALTTYMEKEATPSGARYMQAAAKRGINRSKLNEALNDFISKDMGDPANRNAYANALASINLGAAGNKALNDITGGVVGAIRNGTIQQNGGLLLPSTATDNIFKPRKASKINPKYLSKLTGITDEGILNEMVSNPQNFIA